MDQKITEHFNLGEFTRSAIAEATRLNNDLDNDNDREVIENLRNLCIQVLEPLREFVGVPVIITSGYRCKELNRKVGGVWNSQHLVGEAADIAISDTNDKRLAISDKRLREAFLFIQNNCSFDQLILETKNGRSWIHVSCCRDKQCNRQRSFTISDKNRLAISDKR